MVETINNIVNFIAVNFLLIFGVYSIVFFLLLAFRKDKEVLKVFDKTAIILTIWVGTFWILLKIIGIIIFIFEMKEQNAPEVFTQNLSWYIGMAWPQLVFWLILPHLLRIKFINSYLIPRILIAFFFAFSFEKIIILLTDIHRDYVPVNYGSDINIPELIFVLLFKALIFTLIVSIFHYGKRLIKKES